MHKKGYQCYHPTTTKMYETMDVIFLESETFLSSLASNSSLLGEIRNKKEQNWPTLASWPNTDVRMTADLPTANLIVDLSVANPLTTDNGISK